MAVYIVKPGDSLSAIAAKHGIASWQVLYNHPSNAAFRTLRPNPNLIHPGDKINIPGSPGSQPATNTPIPAAEQPKYAMAIIDGTGPGEDAKYIPSMKYSFCRQLGDALEPINLGKYWRGPGPAGFEVEGLAQSAYEYLLGVHRSNPSTRLMLAGYSRGASAAILAAEHLEKNGNIPVDSLFLFDAVARHTISGGEVIPANVQFSRHVRRDLQATLVLKYEGSFSDAEIKGVSLTNSSNPMRPTFGNTGLTWRGNGDHLPAVPFAGSHGALGGVGWSFVTEDPMCQVRVASYMNAQLAARKVWHNLQSHRPDPTRRKLPGPNEFAFGMTLNALLLMKHRFDVKKAGQVP